MNNGAVASATPELRCGAPPLIGVTEATGGAERSRNLIAVVLPPEVKGISFQAHAGAGLAMAMAKACVCTSKRI